MAARNSWLEFLPKYSLLRNDERKAQLAKQGRDIFDFGIGDPQEETPAFIRQTLLNSVSEVSQYPSALGNAEFRQACAHWAQRRFGVALNSSTEVISCNGSKEAIFHIPQVLLNSASERRMMVFPDPGFPVYKGSCLMAGGVGYEITLKPEKNYVFDPDEIPLELCNKIAACWVSYPHNPTGAVIARHEVEKIYAWALKYDIIILSDECYADMYFPGSAPPESFLTVAAQHSYKNLLCFYSLSKRSGMTGYRSGFVAGSAELISMFAQYRPHAGLGTPLFVQKAAIAAWNEDTHAVHRNTIFAQKRALLDAFLSKNNFEYLKSQATFYVWIKVPKKYESGECYVNDLANATGIVATPGDALGCSTANYFRLALVPTPQKIEYCLELWQKAIDAGIFKGEHE